MERLKKVDQENETAHFNSVDSDIFRDEKDVREFRKMLKESKEEQGPKTETD
jgi:hypothetical protein